MISIEHISLGYLQKTILSADVLTLSPGKIVALTGINGSGKSTLIKAVSGMLEPLKGSVLINGKKVNELAYRERAFNIAIVSTEKTNDDYLDVYTMVSLGRTPYLGFAGQLREEDHQSVTAALNMCGLTDYSWKKVNELSDGEKQRVMIARALAQETPFLILDEPTAFLDVLQRKNLVALLKKIRDERNCAILISTHELELALTFADEFWTICEGKICHSQNAAEAGVLFQKVFAV